MLTFKNIKGKNYKSFKEFELNYENQGLTLVEGVNNTNDQYASNGSGKSSLVSALTYALFGKTGEGIGADDIVNRDNGKGTEVILEFEVNEIPYCIGRYRKHSKNKNKVLLFQEGKEITGDSTKDTNQKIEQITGLDYTLFVTSIMYGQGDTPSFAEATDKQKKEILEKVTDISVYNEAQQIAKEKVKEISEEYAKTDEKVEENNRNIEHYKELNESAKQQLDQYNSFVYSLQNELDNLKKQQTNQNNESTKQQKQEEILHLENNPVEELDLESNSKLEELEQKYNGLKEYTNDYQNKIKVNQSRIQQLQNTRNKLDTSDTCPTCGQLIDATHIKKEYGNLTNQIKELEEENKQTEQMLTGKVKTVFEELTQAIKDEKSKDNEKINEYNQKVKEHNQQISNLKMELRELELEEESLENKIKGKENQIGNLTKPEVKNYDSEIKELEKENKTIIDSKDELFTKQENYEKAVKALGRQGVQSMVLDMIVPFLNEKANSYLDTLSGGILQVNFSTQTMTKSGDLTDKFDVEVTNMGEQSTFQQLSSGEQQRVSIAISLALTDLTMRNSNLRTNIIFLDELFESLDSKSSDNVISLLKDKTNEFSSVFVITHQEGLKPLFENVITVEKNNGESIVKDS